MNSQRSQPSGRARNSFVPMSDPPIPPSAMSTAAVRSVSPANV